MRVIFDTNIYGFLIKEKDSDVLEDKIILSDNIIVYGFDIIRKELRNVPKISKQTKHARITLLNLYDSITDNHVIRRNKTIINLASEYYSLGKDFFGSFTSTKADLMIIACASMFNIDIIYSNDKKAFHSKRAKTIYKRINNSRGIKTPNFLDYQELLELVRSL